MQEILIQHQLWLKNERGKRADLRRADLRRADLQGVNLREADLRRADLRRADLQEIDLQRADLQRADLREADLQRADLREADLRGVNLWKADLRGVDLWKADLWKADLRGANLREAYLREADLREAYLQKADLRGADLRGAKFFQRIPQGDLIVWKNTSKGIVKLLIPKEAKRTQKLQASKFRAEYAIVLEAPENAYSLFNPSFRYIKGETVKADRFNDDIRVECTGGIHFFLSKEEAKEFKF